LGHVCWQDGEFKEPRAVAVNSQVIDVDTRKKTKYKNMYDVFTSYTKITEYVLCIDEIQENVLCIHLLHKDITEYVLCIDEI